MAINHGPLNNETTDGQCSPIFWGTSRNCFSHSIAKIWSKLLSTTLIQTFGNPNLCTRKSLYAPPPLSLPLCDTVKPRISSPKSEAIAQHPPSPTTSTQCKPQNTPSPLSWSVPNKTWVQPPLLNPIISHPQSQTSLRMAPYSAPPWTAHFPPRTHTLLCPLHPLLISNPHTQRIFHQLRIMTQKKIEMPISCPRKIELISLQSHELNNKNIYLHWKAHHFRSLPSFLVIVIIQSKVTNPRIKL